MFLMALLLWIQQYLLLGKYCYKFNYIFKWTIVTNLTINFYYFGNYKLKYDIFKIGSDNNCLAQIGSNHDNSSFVLLQI